MYGPVCYRHNVLFGGRGLKLTGIRSFNGAVETQRPLRRTWIETSTSASSSRSTARHNVLFGGCGLKPIINNFQCSRRVGHNVLFGGRGLKRRTHLWSGPSASRHNVLFGGRGLKPLQPYVVSLAMARHNVLFGGRGLKQYHLGHPWIHTVTQRPLRRTWIETV